MEKSKSVLLYTDWAGPLKGLPLEDVGRLFLGILNYTETGSPQTFDSPAAAMAWEFIRLRLDNNLEKWADTKEKRREAGRRGAQVTNGRERQRAANPANAAFAETKAAKPAVPVPDPVPVPVPGKTSSSSGAGPPGMTTMTPSPECFWTDCGYTGGAAVRDAFAGYRKAGMEDALILEAIRETAAHAAKCPLAYTRRILDQAAAAGQLTLAAWQAGRRPAGSDKRVDRETPSGNDFLQGALDRPRRHKRKD